MKESIFKIRIISWHWRFGMSLRDLDQVLILLRPLGVIFRTTLLAALQSSLIFQNKSRYPGLDDKAFLVFCKSLSQMISNFYRNFILIYEILIKFICCKAFCVSPTEEILWGCVLRAPANSPVWECDFNEAVRQLHWNDTSAWVFSCGFAAHFPGHLFMRTPLRDCFGTC